MSSNTQKIQRKLYGLRQVVDRGIPIGSRERRDAFQIITDVQAMVSEINQEEGAQRIARKAAERAEKASVDACMAQDS